MHGNECQNVKLVKSDHFVWHHRCIALFERLDQLDFASLYSVPVWSSQHFCILLSLCVWLAGWGLGKEAHFRVESEVQASVWGLGRGEVRCPVVRHAGRWVTVTQPLRSDHRSVPFHLHGPAAGHTASAHDLSPSTRLRIYCQCFELQCDLFISVLFCFSFSFFKSILI